MRSIGTAFKNKRKSATGQTLQNLAERLLSVYLSINPLIGFPPITLLFSPNGLRLFYRRSVCQNQIRQKRISARPKTRSAADQNGKGVP